jgi:thiamine monophosphate kinase
MFRGRSIDIFTAPDGEEYVRAQPREGADLAVAGKHGLPEIRLRLLDRSSVGRARKKANRAARRSQEERRVRRRA